jgi:hypothetical protein
MAFTTTELIAKVKLWGTIPSAQPAFTNTQILDIMTDELWTTIAPFIINCREEYYVTTVDHDITTATDQTFDIPSRTVSGTLRDVKLVNSQGDESDMPRINPEYSDTIAYGFFIRDNKLQLLKSEDYSDYSLRLFYYRRPSALVQTSACAQVTSVGSTTFEVSSIPSTMASGETVDIVQANPPFGTLAQDITATWSGTTVTPSTMPSGLAVGDWMCKDQESCIAQIPLEVIPYLVQSTVVKVQEILGDQGNLRRAQEKLEQLKESALSILSPRVTGEIKKIKNNESFLYGTRNWIKAWWS